MRNEDGLMEGGGMGMGMGMGIGKGEGVTERNLRNFETEM